MNEAGVVEQTGPAAPGWPARRLRRSRARVIGNTRLRVIGNTRVRSRELRQ